MRDLDVATPQLPDQLDVVVTGNTMGGSAANHAHHDPKYVRDARPAIDEVADEHAATSLRVAPDTSLVRGVAEKAQERLQLARTAMDIADHVERAVLVLAVVPEGL